MGLLTWLFPPTYKGEISQWTLDGITLSRPIKTPGGGKVTCIGCVADIRFKVRGKKIRAVRVDLAQSSVAAKPVNMFATRRGEAWQASRRERRWMEKTVLPNAVNQMFAQNCHLREAALARMPGSATDRQKIYAMQLGIKFRHDIDKHSIGVLIHNAVSCPPKKKWWKFYWK